MIGTAAAVIIAVLAYANFPDQEARAQTAKPVIDRLERNSPHPEISKEAERSRLPWFVGEIGLNHNQCAFVGGPWSPREDLVRKNYSRTHLVAAERLSGGGYAEIFGEGPPDNPAVIRLYATSIDQCQKLLEGLIRVSAGPAED
jgi:hypothetical protein